MVRREGEQLRADPVAHGPFAVQLPDGPVYPFGTAAARDPLQSCKTIGAFNGLTPKAGARYQHQFWWLEEFVVTLYPDA